jgi:hypothetical protein
VTLNIHEEGISNFCDTLGKGTRLLDLWSPEEKNLTPILGEKT